MTVYTRALLAVMVPVLVVLIVIASVPLYAAVFLAAAFGAAVAEVRR